MVDIDDRLRHCKIAQHVSYWREKSQVSQAHVLSSPVDAEASISRAHISPPSSSRSRRVSPSGASMPLSSRRRQVSTT